MDDTKRPAVADWFDRRQLRKTGFGFVLALVIIGLIFVGVGWERTLERLRMTAYEWVLVASLSTILCLVTWTKIWQMILEVIDIPVPFRWLVVTYFAGTFANYVTPMGQAGGQPFIAYVLSRDTAASYEQSLAIVITADVIRFVPFLTLAILGLGYLMATSQRVVSTELLAVLMIFLAIVPLGAIFLMWRVRERLREALLRVVAPITRRTSRFSAAAVGDRIDRLYGALELIAAAPRRVLVSLAFGYVGWVLFALPLYFSGLALGTPMSLLLVFAVVPAGVLAGATPLPGGLATIEVTVVALLAVLTTLTRADALAVTTIYRLPSYWLVVAVGGLAALWLVRRV